MTELKGACGPPAFSGSHGRTHGFTPFSSSAMMRFANSCIGSRAGASPGHRACRTVVACDVVMFCLFPCELPPMTGVEEACRPAQTSAAVIALWEDRGRKGRGEPKQRYCQQAAAAKVPSPRRVLGQQERGQ